MSIPQILGECDSDFLKVKDAFAANFSERDEVGASVCVAMNGRVVVDLWGGYRDAVRNPWQHDTIVDVFSVGKAMVALSLLVLIDRGLMGFDDLVVKFWPEFAAQGKSDVTVAQLLSHQAGLPGIKKVLPANLMYDWTAMTELLAAEEPWWLPGSAHGYHVNTMGFLGGELVRRVSGSSFGDFFEKNVASPLEIDFHFGVALDQQSRIAEFQFPDPSQMVKPSLENEFSIIYGNPPGVSGFGTVNSPQWRSAVHPSTNGHANARSIARIYSMLASGGVLDGVRIMSADVLKFATTELVCGPDRVLNRNSRFGFGFQLTQPERPMGPNSLSFGHYGAGGSLGMADPQHGLAFGYAMNRFGVRWQDPRNTTLLAAVYESL